MKELWMLDAEPLLTALVDSSASVRVAALRAIVRLRLGRETWIEVSRHVVALLEKDPEGITFTSPLLEGMPYREVIDAAAFVPTRAVRTRLKELLPPVSSFPNRIQDFVPGKIHDSTPAEESIDVPLAIDVPRSPPDPELLSLAAAVNDRIKEHGELDEELRQKAFRAEILPYLPPELASRWVTELFREAVHYALTVIDAPPGNDIVRNVAAMRDRFVPDIQGLFECYWELWQSEEVTIELSQVWSVRWLIAWTVSRAHPKQIISGLAPALRASDSRERELAARLIEESTRYAQQDNPPQFGGGSAPPDLRPSRSVLFDEEEHSSEDYGKSYEGDDQPHRGEVKDESRGAGGSYYYEAGSDSGAVEEKASPDWVDEQADGPPEDGRGDDERASRDDYDWGQKEAVGPPEGGRGDDERASRDDYDWGQRETAGPPEDERGDDERASREDYDWRQRETAGPPEDERVNDERAHDWGQRDKREDFGWQGAAGDNLVRPGLPMGSYHEAEPQEPYQGKRVINTGFAPRNDPDNLVDNTRPLKARAAYYFWLDRSLWQARKSIEVTPRDIPEVADGARLTIAVFGFQDGIEIVRGEDVGEVEVQGDGPFRVVRQPVKESPPRSAHLHERLYFPVRVPQRNGTFQMRCNIYLGQLLLQSRLISARVTTDPRPAKGTRKKVLKSVLDYTLSRQLDPSHLAQLTDHRLSILLNKNGDGSHSFHIFGSDGKQRFKQDDVRFDAGTLSNTINLGRQSLRLASWGTVNELDKEVYKYQDRQKKKDRLQADLTNLAKWGYEFYYSFRKQLAGAADRDRQAVAEFEKLMLEPGIVQIAMKESPSYVLPAALLYDYPLDSAAANEKLRLCLTFEKALDKNEPFEQLDCFLGKCPTRGDDLVICPSGFWGFRHSLGMPLSEENKSDVCSQILVEKELKMAVGVATNLKFLKDHVTAVEADARKLKSGLIWKYAETRDKVFDILKESPHLVYFYCHGGLSRESLPFLQVGASDLIFPSTLGTKDVFWNQPRPLVFINGCHTTAVDPLKALQFIGPLMTDSGSAGVIGTEITIFEELATAFAQECLARFCANEPIGKAIRNARLKLLAEGNPLGLVYIPFVMAGLKLEYQSASTPQPEAGLQPIPGIV
jgi:hypothetical protein